ncbi:methyl-accepting chemotaxis protein [Aliivibrio sifiae]|uniref:methyl-accepting chemotaxis protein n=1 Tax=Aliivibrio sifiae TaxID=566293 RepID=UPI003D1456EF
MKPSLKSPISLLQVFTLLLTSIVICFIGISLLSSRGIDQVGQQFTQLSQTTLPSALSNAKLTKNVLQQVKLMNDGLHVNNEHDLVQIQNTIAQYQQQANKEIESLEHKVSQQDAIITLPQTRQLKQFIHQLNIQSSRILSIQKNILSLSSIIKEKQPSLRYGLSSIGPEMNRISAFLITNNSEADDASNRFVSSSMALETTFLTLMAESDPSTAKKWYREIYNRISALELAYDDLSALYPELTSYMSLSAPLDMVMSEIKHDDSIPNLQLTTLSLLQEQQTLILAASDASLIITTLLSELSRSIELSLGKRSERVNDSIESFKQTMLAVSCVLVITLWLAAIWMRNWMSKGLKNIIYHLKQMSEQNYQHQVPELGPAEMQMIAKKLNKVMASTTHSILSMSNNCDILYQTSEVTNSVSGDIGTSLTQQNEALTSMTSIVSQLDSSINEIAQLTQASHQETHSATQAALNGLTVIDNNNQRLTLLNEALSQNVIAMDTLDSQVEKIQSMVGVIASLAENTNLLALNAAIEAARAGEQGRGFAVVADEVRQLAGSTSKQTQHIRETMNALLKAANETKASISFSQTEMALALESSLDVSATFKLISETVTHISDRISQVSVATEEQAQAASEVNSNINSINQYGVKIELQLNAFVESTEEVAGIASQQKELIARYHL